MARITVEDCLKKINNRFVLINMVAKRVRQIREGSEYLVNSPKNEDIVIALREVAAGKVTIRDSIAAEAAASVDPEAAAATPESTPPESAAADEAVLESAGAPAKDDTTA